MAVFYAHDDPSAAELVDGAVAATDLDTTVLRELSRPNLEIRVHEVLTDDLQQGRELDLLRLRLLLVA